MRNVALDAHNTLVMKVLELTLLLEYEDAITSYYDILTLDKEALKIYPKHLIR